MARQDAGVIPYAALIAASETLISAPRLA